MLGKFGLISALLNSLQYYPVHLPCVVKVLIGDAVVFLICRYIVNLPTH